MRKRFQTPSPAMIVALIALVAAMSGVAVAAVKIGGKNIKANAIKTSKIKDGAVTGPKLAAGAVSAANLAPGAIPSSSLGDGSVSTAKLADGSVTTGKIADGAVTAAKLDPSERSEAFTAKRTANLGMPSNTDTVAIQTSLPTPGDYLFTVSAEFGGGGVPTSFDCDLLDANNPVAEAFVPAPANQFVAPISLTGASDGGIVRLRCNPGGAVGAQVRNVFLTAVRVGTVTPLTATP